MCVCVVNVNPFTTDVQDLRKNYREIQINLNKQRCVCESVCVGDYYVVGTFYKISFDTQAPRIYSDSAGCVRTVRK